MARLALRLSIQLSPILGSHVPISEEELISFIQLQFPVCLSE